MKREHNPSVPTHHIYQLLHQWRFYTCSALTRHVILSTHLPLSHNISLADTWCVTEEGRGEREAWLMIEPVSQRRPYWPLFTCLFHQRPNRATFQSVISLGHLSANFFAFCLFISIYLHCHDILLPVSCEKKRMIFYLCGQNYEPPILFT